MKRKKVEDAVSAGQTVVEPTRRPQRARAAASKAAKKSNNLWEYDPNLNVKWSLGDKQLLLEALKRLPATALTQIQHEYLPHRKTQEIDHFIKRMKMKNINRDIFSGKEIARRAPIEAWLQTAEDLTYYDLDYSYLFGQVMSIAGNLEEHDPPQEASDPDWTKLYRSLVAMLRGDVMPDMGSVEAAVLLDVTQTLADQMTGMDTTAQREMMRRKHTLLNASVDINNKEASYMRARKALEEDLLEVGVADTPPPEEEAAAPKVHKKRGRKRKGEQAEISDPRPKRTSLYSINPFCIPVKYLRPVPKGARPFSQPLPGTAAQKGSSARAGDAAPADRSGIRTAHATLEPTRLAPRHRPALQHGTAASDDDVTGPQTLNSSPYGMGSFQQYAGSRASPAGARGTPATSRGALASHASRVQPHPAPRPVAPSTAPRRQSVDIKARLKSAVTSRRSAPPLGTAGRDVPAGPPHKPARSRRKSATPRPLARPTDAIPDGAWDLGGMGDGGSTSQSREPVTSHTISRELSYDRMGATALPSDVTEAGVLGTPPVKSAHGGRRQVKIPARSAPQPAPVMAPPVGPQQLYYPAGVAPPIIPVAPQYGRWPAGEPTLPSPGAPYVPPPQLVIQAAPPGPRMRQPATRPERTRSAPHHEASTSGQHSGYLRDGEFPSIYDITPQNKRISIKETEGGTTTICITDLMGSESD